MKALALSVAFFAGIIVAGQLIGQSMANMVDDARSQQCIAGRVTVCNN